MVHKEEVGGSSSRTVRIDVASGRVQLRTAGETEHDVEIHLRRIRGILMAFNILIVDDRRQCAESSEESWIFQASR